MKYRINALLAGLPILLLTGILFSTVSAEINAPQVLGVQPLDSASINIVWHDNSINEFGFFIYRKSALDVEFSRVGAAAQNATAYTDRNLAGDTKYYYILKAYNATDSSVASNIDSATTLPSPSAPIIISIRYDTNQAIATFDFIITDTNQVGYFIYQKSSENAFYKIASIPIIGGTPDTFYFTDTCPPKNCLLSYKVALNPDSQYSDISNTFFSYYPDTLYLSNVTLFIDSATPSILLDFSDNNFSETGYDILRGRDSNLTKIATILSETPSTTGRLLWTDTTVQYDSGYFYSVSPFNDSNRVETTPVWGFCYRPFHLVYDSMLVILSLTGEGAAHYMDWTELINDSLFVDELIGGIVRTSLFDISNPTIPRFVKSIATDSLITDENRHSRLITHQHKGKQIAYDFPFFAYLDDTTGLFAIDKYDSLTNNFTTSFSDRLGYSHYYFGPVYNSSTFVCKNYFAFLSNRIAVISLGDSIRSCGKMGGCSANKVSTICPLDLYHPAEIVFGDESYYYYRDPHLEYDGFRFAPIIADSSIFVVQKEFLQAQEIYYLPHSNYPLHLRSILIPGTIALFCYPFVFSLVNTGFFDDSIYVFNITNPGFNDKAGGLKVDFKIKKILLDQKNNRLILFGLDRFAIYSMDYQQIGTEKAFPSENGDIVLSPNPFNPTIKIRLPKTAKSVSVKIYNSLGQTVASFKDIKTRNLIWTAHGSPSGIYYIRLFFDGQNYVRKAILLK